MSLAKEVDGQKVLRESGKDEAQSRGTIDQDPIIQDVPERINEHERRFVVVSDLEGEAKSSGALTPPTSEDERTRRVKRRPSAIHTDLNQKVPEMGKRTASPYAFTKPPQPTSSSNDRFLSPDTLTPPATDLGRRHNRTSSRSKAPSPRRDSARLSPSSRRGNNYFSTRHARDDNAIDDLDWEDLASTGTRQTSAQSTTTTYAPSSSPRTSIHDCAPPPTHAPSTRRLNLDARRHTDTPDTLPKLQINKSRRPTPLVSSSALGEASHAAVYTTATLRARDVLPPRSRESSYTSSRAASPASATTSATPSPPRSPRLSSEFSPSPSTAQRSPTFRSGSGSGSRPSSPVPRVPGDSARLPRADQDWAQLPTRRPNQPSRLAASVRQESVPDMHRTPMSATPTSRPTGVLPYPEDDGPDTPSVYMPSETGYQFSSDIRPSLGVPLHEAKTLSRASSPAPSTAFRRSDKPPRPSMPTRHSTANVSSVEERPRAPARRQNSYSTSSQTRKELAALLKKGLPDCPRANFVTGYDDWYTVIGAPSLDFCPECVTSVFERTVFRPSIRRSLPRNLGAEVQCAFGSSPWIRLAWLLTLQQQRADLTLLRDLAEIDETSESCPGAREAARSWYGLRDPGGLFVRDFQVCYSDVRKIERLLPTLSGLFVRLPQRASFDTHTCAVRAEGNRFSTYLDALILTHEKAMASRKGADPMAFIDLVERKARLRECSRDTMLVGGLWHFVPSLPHLTVCEDCFESVVEPAIQRNSDVATRFNRTVQPVYGEGMGSSCQLYSPRMRNVFQRAVADGDVKYLTRKAKERREAELMLQERYRDVLRRAKRMSREGSGSGSGSEDDERRLNWELKRITAEWQEKWE